MCMEGVFARPRVNWDKPRLFDDKATQSELSRVGEKGQDKRVNTQ